MNQINIDNSEELCRRIIRLVEERGWNQLDLARQAGLNRLTVAKILHGRSCHLRISTIQACARALGFSVDELRHAPLEDLVLRIRRASLLEIPDHLRCLYEQAAQTVLLTWLENHPDKAARLTSADLDELLSLQGIGGPLTAEGLDHFLDQIERKRKLKEQIDAIAGTDYLSLVEQLVGLVFEKIQPYRDRT